MRGAASTQELLRVVHQDALQNGEELVESAAKKRFEEDRARLRQWFQVELRHDRTHDVYILENMDRPMLDLPETAVRGLAFLEQTFSDNAAPMRAEVQQFLSHVEMLLPRQTSRMLKLQRGLLEVNLKTRDSDIVPDDVWDAVQTTCAERRQLEFEYRSPQQEDEQVRRHTVEPFRYFFDTVRGHYYLEAYCIEARGPHGVISQNQMITYRLGRMQNPQPLPKRFVQRRVPEHPLDYVLSANIARLGVTEHFAKAQVFPNEDGSVLIRAMSNNLFFDIRTLLHYGENCRVIGGDAAVREIKKIVTSLAAIYAET